MALTAPERWEPDVGLVAAVLSMPKASRKMTELSDADRAWLVAGLTLVGVTAQDIADRLGCSLRLVRSIRAEPITQMAVLWQESERAAEAELRSERGGHGLTRRELAEKATEATRLRRQLEEVVKAKKAGALALLPCGHPKVRHNVYTHTVRERGRERVRDFCRECGREKSAIYRERKRTSNSGQQNHSTGMTVSHLHVVRSGA